MKSVLITGGSGTLGNALTARLLSGNVERICILSRGEKAQSDMRARFGDSRMRYFIRDVRDRDGLQRAMRGCDVVIHAAALKRIDTCHYNPDEAEKTNVGGTINVRDIAEAVGVKRVILTSTDKACEPVSTYGRTKATAEDIFINAHRTRLSGGPRFATVRYGNVWGSTGSVVPQWRAIIASGGTPFVTDRSCTRFFMLVSQAVDFVLGTLETMPEGISVPRDLPAYSVKTLLEAMNILRYEEVGLNTEIEKYHESMLPGLSSDKARQMTPEELRMYL